MAMSNDQLFEEMKRAVCECTEAIDKKLQDRCKTLTKVVTSLADENHQLKRTIEMLEKQLRDEMDKRWRVESDLMWSKKRVEELRPT